MDIIICTLNSQYIHSSLAPWCLLAGLHTYAPHLQAEVLEGTVNQPEEEILSQLIIRKPKVIGFCCYIWNIRSILSLVQSLHRLLPKTSIVLGGPEAGFRPESLLMEYPVDAVLTGEGERSFALLCENLLCGTGHVVPGLSCIRNGQIETTPEVEENDPPPSPYTPEYLNALNGRVAYLETSRGCPYSCAYCLSGRCGRLKFFPMERVKNELILLANSGTKTVKLVDRTFNAHRKRAVELFSFIIEEYGKKIPKGVCFHFEIAGDLLDDETVALLAKAPAGSMQLEIGVQSFNRETLIYIQRKTDLDRLTYRIRQLLQPGNIHIHIDLIAGLPLEDFNSFANSVDQAFALQPHMLQFGFLKLLHGSPMREQPERYPCKFDPMPPYEVQETPSISNEELQRLHAAEWSLDCLYNSGRFPKTLPYLLNTSHLTPFSFFLRFGETVKLPEGASLDRLTEALFQFGKSFPNVDETELRNRLVCDRLQTVKGGRLPACLQIKDPRLKTMRIAYRKLHPPVPGQMQGSALLYQPMRLAVVNYIDPDPVTKIFPVSYLSLQDMVETD